jgi:hypothetical protein
MQIHVLKFTRRFGAAVLALAGVIAAATAHADPGKDLSAAPPLALEPPRQCTAVDAIIAKLRFPTGTTFLLTDAGLVVLEQPKAARALAPQPEPEPEPWGNSGG